MRTAIRGTLRWLSAEKGGRRQPFAGLRYATVARFPGPRHSLERRCRIHINTRCRRTNDRFIPVSFS